MEPFGTESLQISRHTEIGSHNDDLIHLLHDNTFCMLSYAKKRQAWYRIGKFYVLLQFDPLYSDNWNRFEPKN